MSHDRPDRGCSSTRCGKGAPATIPADATLRLLPDRTAALPRDPAQPDRVPRAPARVPRGDPGRARARRPATWRCRAREVAPAVDAAELQRARGRRGGHAAARPRRAGGAGRRARAARGLPLVSASRTRFRWRDVAAQVTAVLAEADRRLAAVDAMTLDRAAAAPEEQVRFDQERLRDGLRCSVPRAAAACGRRTSSSSASSLRRSDELQGGDPLQALSWLQGAGRVRPGASRLGHALSYAAALERAPAKELKVAQLPFARRASAGSGSRGATPPRGQGLARRAPAAAVPDHRAAVRAAARRVGRGRARRRGHDRRGVQLRGAGRAAAAVRAARGRAAGHGALGGRDARGDAARDARAGEAARRRPAGARATTRCCSARCRRCT